MYKYLLLILTFIFVSCSEKTLNRNSETLLHTDKNLYTAEDITGQSEYPKYRFSLIGKFINTTEDTVYLDRCYPSSTQPVYSVGFNGEHPSAYGTVIACVGHDNLIAVKPNETRIDTFNIQGPYMIKDGEAIGVFEGKHQIRYFTYSCQQGALDCKLPDSISTSQSFMVETEGWF